MSPASPHRGPLLERSGPIGVLFAVAAEVVDGAPRAVVVTGEAGVGKSRLCHEFVVSLPEPWRLGEIAPVTVEEDLHDRGPDEIDALVDKIGDRPGLILCTCRLEAVDPGSSLARALLRLLREPASVQVDLRPLSAEATVTLAQALDPTVGDAVLDTIVARSGGIPFYVEELVRAGHRGVPWSVSAAVLHRVDEVDPVAREVVAVVAMLGRRVTRTLIEALVPDPPLSAMLRAQLLLEEAGALALRHDIVGDVVLEQLATSARTRLHRQIGDALRDADGDPVAIASHYEASGDTDAARTYAWAAAEHSLRAGFAHRATRMYGLALSEGPGDRSGHDLHRAAIAAAAAGQQNLAERWARDAEAAHRRAGDAHAAAAVWLDHGLKYVRRPQLDPVDLEARSPERLAVEATAAARRGDAETAAATAAEALVVAEAQGRSDAAAQAALALCLGGRPTEALDALERLRRRAVVADDALTEARRSSDLARVAFAVGDPAAAERHQRAAMAAGRRVPESDETRYLELGLAATVATIGRLADAEELATPLLGHENRIVALMAQAPLCIADLARGATDSASTRLDLLLPFRELAGPEVFGTALSDLARVLLQRGQLDDARAALADADAWVGGIYEETRPDRLETAIRVAVLADDDAALRRAAAEITRLASAACAGAGLHGLAEWSQGLVDAREGRPLQAHAHLVAGARWLTAAPRLVKSADAWCDAAVVALAMGDRERICADLAEAETIALEHGHLAVLERIAAITAAAMEAGHKHPDVARLTPRERSLLEHLVTGATNKEIAAALHLSEKTVRNQLSLLFAKVGFRRRSEAAAFAVAHGLVARLD